jgi:OmpA-OmpF porin, OOP family
MAAPPPSPRTGAAIAIRRRLSSLAASGAAVAAGVAFAAGPRPAIAQGTPPPWNAMPVTGLYLGAGVGANWVGSTSLDQSGSLTARLRSAGYPAPGGKAEFETGIAVVGSLGWGFGNGLRAEVEFDYRNNGLDRITGFGGLGAAARVNNVGGTQHSYGLMFNALYDFVIAGAPWAVPYLGAGIGMAWTNWTGNRTTAVSTLADRPNVVLDYGSTDFNFAYQAIAGVAFPVADVPGLAVTTEFRFFGTLQNKFDASLQLIDPRTGAVARDPSGSVKADNHNYSLMLGVRYNFGRVPPPPPVAAPPPAPAPTRTYLVFFDWDRADLTDRARQIIAEAAQNSHRVQTTRIEVAGHADRSGSPEYNQRLSRRRADTVAAELVRNGVPREAIGIEAFGESRPLVPTADGVREPQNRRVEIVLR